MQVKQPHAAETVEQFLAGVERRALKIAEIAVGDRDDALDIVQDAMFKLVQKYRRRPAAEWPPLFYRILNSRIMDHHRKRARTARVMSPLVDNGDSEEFVDGRLPDPVDTNPADLLVRRQAIARVESALARLPLRQQQAFLLRAWEGMDTRSVATAMRCSEGSVKTHLSRAMRSLRLSLES